MNQTAGQPMQLGILTIDLPMIPPSTNHAYENIPVKIVRGKHVGGGRRLSEDGKLFKLEVTNILSREYADQLSKLRPNVPYGLMIVLHLPDMYNSSYPAKAKNRFRKMDASNHVKLLEDVLCEVTGIDDSQFVSLVVLKRSNLTEHTSIVIWDPRLEPPVVRFQEELK